MIQTKANHNDHIILPIFRPATQYFFRTYISVFCFEVGCAVQYRGGLPDDLVPSYAKDGTEFMHLHKLLLIYHY